MAALLTPRRCCLACGYATGLHTRSKIERACCDSVAMRFIAAKTQPDHDRIAIFRRRFLPQIEALFVQVRMLARAMMGLKLVIMALDGTKATPNASKPRSGPGRTPTGPRRLLRKERQSLLKLAEDSDSRPINDGLDGPTEIARREQRLGARAQAKILARTAECHAVEQQAHETKCAKRQAQREAGKEPLGPASRRHPASPRPAIRSS